MGRPRKLDDLVSRRILDSLENGVSRTGAAHAARVGYSTLKGWLADGREGIEPYATFLAAVLEAEAKAERTVVERLFEATKKGNVGAMCFWLERRRHEEWGKHDTVTHEHRESSETGLSDLEVARSVVSALESRKTGTNG